MNHTVKIRQEFINSNILDWKQYNLSSPSLNQRSLLQLNIDSTDAVMMGTEHSS